MKTKLINKTENDLLNDLIEQKSRFDNFDKTITLKMSKMESDHKRNKNRISDKLKLYSK